MINEIKRLEEENEKMREVLMYANNNLVRIWHSLQKGQDLDLLTEIGIVGTAIENTLNELGE